MRPIRGSASLLVVAIGACVVASCGAGSEQAGSSRSPSASASAPDAPEGQSPSGTPSAPAEGADLTISVTVNSQRFTAKLDDSAASRDLLAQLPQPVEMSDHGGVEKTGPLRSPLSLNGQPDGADPNVGDLGYYAPGNDLVLYYGDQSYYPGIVILGKLEGDAPRKLSEMNGQVSVNVETQ